MYATGANKSVRWDEKAGGDAVEGAVEEENRLMKQNSTAWFANNTSGIKSNRFSFLVVQLRRAMPSAVKGNHVTWPSLRAAFNVQLARQYYSLGH
jgi:hypothetical protein